MAREVEWNEELDIGVELVDKAHRRLFSIVRRILLLTEEEKNNQWACIEGIKYFKSYTVEHFREEEGYMRSVNYPGYAVHKQLHDNLREKTIPALERNLEKSDYSVEAVEQFLGVCIGWLTGHIMVEDKAMTGKAVSRWPHEQVESVNQTLEAGLRLAVKEVFFRDAQIFSDHYGGESLGKAMVYRLVYAASDGGQVRVLFAVENGLALSTMEASLGMRFLKVNQTANAFIGLALQQVLRSLSSYFDVPAGSYRLEEEVRVSESALQEFFRDRYPEYSMLLDTDVGRLAFCLRTQSPAQVSPRAS